MAKPLACFLAVALFVWTSTAGESVSDSLGKTYYLDCEGGSDAHSGTAPSTAWKSLEKLNESTFSPGDSILIKRGTYCRGVLRPRGSGAPGRPITLGAFGTGALPQILNPAEPPQAGAADGQAIHPTLQLFNQQYWHVRNLELIGGLPYGLLISGDRGILRHFRITDLVVRDVTGRPENKRTGLLAIIAGSPEQSFDDIVLDGVTAFNTTQWAGIVIDGGHPPLPKGADGKTPPTLKASNVSIRNCLVHHVAGDGIVLFRVRKGLLESNVAWATGMLTDQGPTGPKNPNAIWVWRCEDCVVQHNEGFLAESEGVDGGVYDIDWGSHRNVVQYNFGHDSQGYCLSVFGAGGGATTDSVVRFNVCINNGRSPRLAQRQGDMYLSTWGGGSLDGVQIHNNTFIWHPAVEAPFLKEEAVFVGTRPNFFRNNLVVSSSPLLVQTSRDLRLEKNLYWYIGIEQPSWSYGGKPLTGFEQLRTETGQEKEGLFADPQLRGPGESPLPLQPIGDSLVKAGDGQPQELIDFFGNPMEGAKTFIGAVRPSSTSAKLHKEWEVSEGVSDLAGRLFPESGQKKGWAALLFLSAEALDPKSLPETRSLVVSLRSQFAQYSRLGLRAAILVSGVSGEIGENLSHDWQLEQIRLFHDIDHEIEKRLRLDSRPTLVMIDPAGAVVERIQGKSNPARIGLLFRWWLGPPPGLGGLPAL